MPKSTIETVQQSAQNSQYVPSIFLVDFEQVTVFWDVTLTSLRSNFGTNSNCLSIYTLFLNFIVYQFIFKSSKAVFLQ